MGRGKSDKATELPPRYTPGFMRELDQRSALSLRLTTAYKNIVADLGGESEIGHIKAALIERFVFLEALLQTWEAVIAQDPLNHVILMGRVAQSTNTLQGLALKIGMDRIIQPAGVADLRAYVRERSA